jgi:hypothetical protein
MDKSKQSFIPSLKSWSSKKSVMGKELNNPQAMVEVDETAVDNQFSFSLPPSFSD